MSLHDPVMCREVLDLFAPFLEDAEPFCILDATFGRGGHSIALLETYPQSSIIAVDRDPEAVSYAHSAMASYGARFRIVHHRFSQMEILFSPQSFSGVLFDFGMSSPQLDEAQRGFSFQKSGPLDMRMDLTGPSAAELINTLAEKELADLFFHYGQERFSRRIARSIVHQRRLAPLTRTEHLSNTVQKVMPRRGKIHPATRVFQALRIAVNKELEEIERALPQASHLLKPKGRLVTLSFHSLEDRLCKHFFKNSLSFDSFSKKPLRPDAQEKRENPRSRSACLRFGIRAP